jgi:hypothetical protein
MRDVAMVKALFLNSDHVIILMRKALPIGAILYPSDLNDINLEASAKEI